jgi:tetratricopeptide (TPR) repeat protein
MSIEVPGPVNRRSSREIAAALAAAILLFVTPLRSEPGGDSPRALAWPATMLSVPAVQLPETVRARYRLAPDRRLLLAVSAVAAIVGCEPQPPATALYDAGSWHVRYGAREIGTVGETPTLEQGTRLLESWATATGCGSRSASTTTIDASGIARSIAAVDARSLLAALASLDHGAPASPPGVARSRAVAHGLAWLATWTTDSLEQGDALLADAWAWLAVSGSAGATPALVDRVLIARALGYEAAAVHAAAGLPDDDPVRLYAAGDERALAAYCGKHRSELPANLLELELLAGRGLGSRFRAALASSPFAERRGDLLVLGLESQVAGFAQGPKPGLLLASCTRDTARRPLDSALGPAPALEIDPSTQSDSTDFEQSVRDLVVASGTGTLGPAIAAFYRALYYSGLYRWAAYPVDIGASGPMAQAFATAMGRPAPGTADELRQWLQVRAEVLSGSTDMIPVVHAVAGFTHLGGQLPSDLAQTMSRHTDTLQTGRRAPIAALFEHLDTRPVDLARAARLARSNLSSAWLYESFARGAAEAAPHLCAELPAIVAELDGDRRRLRQIADDAAMPSYARSAALWALSRIGTSDDTFVRSRFEAIAGDPDEGAGPLIDFLERRHDLAGAVAAVTRILARLPPSSDLARAYLLSEKARLLLLEGKDDEAAAAVEPAVVTGKEDALLEAAEVELARHRPERALELASGSLSRYPDRAYQATALVARAHWQRGEFAEAARIVASSRTGIVAPWSKTLPEAFAAEFSNGDEEKARSAFAELVRAGVPAHNLADTAIALGKARGPELALALVDGLHDQNPAWQNHILLATYDFLSDARGRAEALAWLRPRLPFRSHEIALNLFQENRYELLLELFPNPTIADAPAIVRILKAASLLQLRESSGVRWSGLAAEISQERGDDFFIRGARFFVGQVPASNLFELDKGLDDLASAAWAMAVEERAAGHQLQSEAWAQVALETGQFSEPPFVWTKAMEDSWLGARRSLDLPEKPGGSHQ